MNKIQAIISKIEAFANIALFTHKNIDGDSYASAYGLALAIKEKYPHKQVYVLTDVAYLKTNFPFLEAKAGMFSKKVKAHTLGIIGDTAVKERIQFWEELAKCQEIICYDHHQNQINFTANIYWREPTYPASALQATELALTMQHQVKENTALALLFGILTDTGFFRYSTNNTKAPSLYAKLLAFTTDRKINDLFVRMNTKTKDDIAIYQYIYSNIIFKKNVAYIIINKKLIQKYHYTQLKFKINTIANIAGCDYWAFFMETRENGFKYKVSLRTSKKNVNKIAQKYGGGGHIKAAGCFARDNKEMLQIISDMVAT